MDDTATIRFHVIVIRPGIGRSPAGPVGFIRSASLRRHGQANRRNSIPVHQIGIGRFRKGCLIRAISLNHVVGNFDGYRCQSNRTGLIQHHFVVVQGLIEVRRNAIAVQAAIRLVLYIVGPVLTYESTRCVGDTDFRRQFNQAVPVFFTLDHSSTIQILLNCPGIPIGFRIVASEQMQCGFVDGGIAVFDLDVVVLDVQADAVFIQGLNDVQGFQGIPSETADLQDADLIDAVFFHIGQHVLNLLPVLVLL